MYLEMIYSIDSHFYIQPERAQNAPHKRFDGCLNFENNNDIDSNSQENKYEW